MSFFSLSNSVVSPFLLFLWHDQLCSLQRRAWLLRGVDLLPVSSPGLGWSPGISCWFTPFHAWCAAGPVLVLPCAPSHQLQKLPALSSVKSPGIDEGLVKDFNLAQIIGLSWNLLPVSFRSANTNSWSLILHKHNRPQCHMELIRAASHC